MRILIAGRVGFVGGTLARSFLRDSREVVSFDIDELSSYRVNYTLTGDARAGDHIWWIIDVRRFQHDYSVWVYQHDLRSSLAAMIDAAKERYRTQLA